jgi:hypothetical protein
MPVVSTPIRALLFVEKNEGKKKIGAGTYIPGCLLHEK